MSTHKNSQSNLLYLTQNLNQTEIRQKTPKKDQKLSQNLNQKRSLVFTDLSIKHLKPLEKRTIWWCRMRPDFGIRVNPKGAKTWIYRYRFNNRTRKLTLGKYPIMGLREATKQYIEASDKVLYGTDPLELKQHNKQLKEETLNLASLIELYLEHGKKSGKKSVLEEERTFRTELPLELRNSKISDIGHKSLAKMFHSIIVRGSPSTASHLYSYTRRLFNFAADMGLMKRSENPCNEIRLNISKNKRQRHLSPKEIYLFWHRVNDLKTAPIIKLALKFLLLTVARSGEVLNAKWKDIDLSEGVWVLPNTKNGQSHRIYLGELAIEILNEASILTGTKEYVFCSPRNPRKKHDRHIHGVLERNALSKALYREFDLFKITEKFTPHDLRRTGATLIAALFGRRDFASLALNHVSNSVTAIYDQYIYDKEKKDISNALNMAVDLIAKSPNVESVPSLEELRNEITNRD